MSLSTNKIILASTQSNTAGAYFPDHYPYRPQTAATVPSCPLVFILMYPQANVSVIAYNGSSNATLMAADAECIILFGSCQRLC